MLFVNFPVFIVNFFFLIPGEWPACVIHHMFGCCGWGGGIHIDFQRYFLSLISLVLLVDKQNNAKNDRCTIPVQL